MQNVDYKVSQKTSKSHKVFPRYNFESRTKLSGNEFNKYINQFTFGYKPSGRWYSIYSAWVSWGEITHGDHIHKITFHPKVHIFWNEFKYSRNNKYKIKEKILVLRTFEEIKEFTDEYIILYKTHKFIRWKDVAEKCGGVEFRCFKTIATYIRKHKLISRYLWYLTIDVSSGCVWDHKLVKNIEYVFDNVCI